MKIEIKERDVNYYDEVLYICTFMKKILNNPTSKVLKLSKYYLMGIVLTAICALLFCVFCFIGFYSETLVFLLFIELIILIRFLVYYVKTKKLLITYSKGNGNSMFEITEDVIKLNNFTDTEISVNWNSVSKVLFNRHSIVFIPKEQASVVLSVDSKHADEVLKAIDKYEKNQLVIDNRKLYK